MLFGRVLSCKLKKFMSDVYHIGSVLIIFVDEINQVFSHSSDGVRSFDKLVNKLPFIFSFFIDVIH